MAAKKSAPQPSLDKELAEDVAQTIRVARALAAEMAAGWPDGALQAAAALVIAHNQRAILREAEDSLHRISTGLDDIRNAIDDHATSKKR